MKNIPRLYYAWQADYWNLYYQTRYKNDLNAFYRDYYKNTGKKPRYAYMKGAVYNEANLYNAKKKWVTLKK